VHAPRESPPGALTLVDVRRLWPEIVEAVKSRRRVTWIQLSQHAQVVGLDGSTLTVGFNNAGARESFVNGGSDVILQQVLIDLVGQEYKIDAITDPSAQPGTEPPIQVTRPAAATPPTPAAPASRTASTPPPPTSPAPTTASTPPETPTTQKVPQTQEADDAAAHRDDPDVEDELDGPELLTERLGAEVIEEIPHH